MNNSNCLTDLGNKIRSHFAKIKYGDNHPYYHINNFFEKELITKQLINHIQIESESYITIFQKSDPHINDNKRRAQSLKANQNEYHPLPVIMTNLDELMGSANPNLKKGEYTLICSHKGCEQQVAHTDYYQQSTNAKRKHKVKRQPKPKAKAKAKQKPGPKAKGKFKTKLAAKPTAKAKEYSFFGFIATMDGTVIIGYNKDGSQYTINLNAGDVLICREDFVHAGGGYEVFNFRSHGYFDNKKSKVKRKKDTTYLVELKKNADSWTTSELIGYYSRRRELNLQGLVTRARNKMGKKARSLKMLEGLRKKKRKLNE